MQKFLSKLRSLDKKSKSILFFCCFILLLAGSLTGTHAWRSLGQGALNMGHNEVVEKDVYLLKLERDIDGKETEIAIENATFYLYQKDGSKDIQIGDLYTTNKEGKVNVSLAPGEYYFEEVDPSSGYTYDEDEEGNLVKRYPFKVTLNSNSEEAIVVAYNRKQLGNLKLTKTVKNADDSDITEEQAEQLFEFKIIFSDGGSYYYSIDGEEKQLIASGSTLSLKHEQMATFENIPLGVQYRITEKTTAGFESIADNTSGTISETPILVNVVNIFNLNMGNLEVSKTVVNGDGTSLTQEQKEKEFEFIIFFKDTNEHFEFITNMDRKGTLTSGDSFTLKVDEVLTVMNLPIGLEYEVHETEIEDYTSSPSNYVGQVLSTDVVRLPFLNQYQTDLNKTGSLCFSKKIEADQINKDQMFSFILTFSDNEKYEYRRNNEEPVLHTSGEKITLKHGDTIIFPKLPAGVSYQLVEEQMEGYQSQLEEVNGTILSDQEISFTFVNYFEEKASLVIKKIGEGEHFDQTKEFVFTVWINGEELSEKIVLKAGETSSKIPLNLGDTWQVVEQDAFPEDYEQTSIINGIGVASHANEVNIVTQTNRYIGRPMVTLTGKKTWRIPDNIQIGLPEKITVQLKDGEKVVESQEVTGPEWEYQFEVPKYNDKNEEIQYSVEELPIEHFRPNYTPNSFDIENIYLEPVVLNPFEVEKRITGDKPELEDEFEFRLTPGNQTVVVKGEGKATFDSITLTNAGKYEYTITERNSGLLGYTYDSSTYTWVITVVEKNQKLIVASMELKKDGKDYGNEIAVFENHFEVVKTIHEKIEIAGKKTWLHGDNPKLQQPLSITVLLNANGEKIYQREISESDNWSYSFRVDRYDKDGKEIAYSIDELPVTNYSKDIQGFNLINTHTGSKNEKPNQSKDILPSTGEKITKYVIYLGVIILFTGIYLRIKLLQSKRK